MRRRLPTVDDFNLPAHISRLIVARLKPDNSCARLIVIVRGALALSAPAFLPVTFA
jgi:hypothetical protein